MIEKDGSSLQHPGSRGSAIFEHLPHPRIAARKAAGPARTVDHRFKGKGRSDGSTRDSAFS